MATEQRVLAIAAASGRVGYVVLENLDVTSWGLSRKAGSGITEATRCASNWIGQIRPDVVVTELVLPRSKKGSRTKDVIAAITSEANAANVLNLEVVRRQTYSNKFKEAAALAKDHPKMAHLVPKERRPWESEPKTTVYFEALALALSAFGNPNVLSVGES